MSPARRERPAALCLVLHAHLPFVRHPEDEDFLEERWLYDAVADCYVPLAEALLALRARAVPFALAIALSPTLVAMLDDPLLRARTRRHLIARGQAAHALSQRDRALAPAARDEAARALRVLRALDRWDDDALTPFVDLARSGHVELLAESATHGLLPLLATQAGRKAQLQVGVRAFRRRFGRAPTGVWLAECGLESGTPELLARLGVRYFLAEATALEHASPPPPAGVYRPARTPAGPCLFARDRATARQVWDATVGYPGHPVYRERHRVEVVRVATPARDVPAAWPRTRSLELRPYRIASGAAPDAREEPYDPRAARAQARAHAAEFVRDRVRQAAELRAHVAAPVITACYDAELFGHWWYEGPTFLAEVLRRSAATPGLETSTPARQLGRPRELPVAAPYPSTWGAGGALAMWCNPDNAWALRHQQAAELAFVERVGRTRGDGAHLVEAGRELLLLQSSDWAFMLTTGAHAEYARRRVMAHAQAVERLLEPARATGPGRRARAEQPAPLFPWLDLEPWRTTARRR